jgi:hypothetical protein
MFYIAAGLIFEQAIFIDYTKWLLPGEKKKEEAAVKEAIVLYDKIYSDLYASDGQTLRLDEFPAVKLLRHQVYRDLDFLRSQKRLLIYDMASVNFMEINMPAPSMAEVTVFEEWNYVYQKSSTREPVQQLKGMGEGFKYFMQKQDGKWVVLDTIHVMVSQPEKKDGLYY